MSTSRHKPAEKDWVAQGASRRDYRYVGQEWTLFFGRRDEADIQQRQSDAASMMVAALATSIVLNRKVPKIVDFANGS